MKTIYTAILFIFFFESLYSQDRYGLIIGTNYNGNQAGITPLELCEKDAKYLEDKIKKVGNFTDVNVLLGRQVTKSNIERAFQELASKSKRDDTVFVYFSGHGSKEMDSRSPTGTRNFLVCFDKPHLYDHELDRMIGRISSPKTVMVLDCCYSGGITGKGKATRGTGEVPIAQGMDGVVRQNAEDFLFQNKPMVASSDSSQVSWEVGGNINHGIFTYNFGQALEKGDLNKDKVVTVLEAFFFSREGTIQMARRIGQEQNPQISGNASGVFLAGDLTPTPAPPPPKPPTNIIPPEEQSPPPSSVPAVITPITPPTIVTIIEPPAPPVVNNNGNILIKTTIIRARELISSRGVGTPYDLLKRQGLPSKQRVQNQIPDSQDRRIQVLINGEEYKSELRPVKSQVWGSYMSQGRMIPGEVYHIFIKDVPAGVHQIKVIADEYPQYETAVGVLPRKDNVVDLVTSVRGFGAIQGRVFYKTLDNPVINHPVFMPTIVSTRGVQRVNTDKDGTFHFTNLRPGTYEIRASFAETLKLENSMIKVQSGEVTKVDIILNVKMPGTKTKI